jgi:hypothetical protein
MAIQYLDQPSTGTNTGTTIQYLDDGSATPLPSLMDTVKGSVKQIFDAPASVAQSIVTDPIGTFKKNQNLLPAEGAIAGTAFAPGLGTAIGAGIGQIGRNMAQIAEGQPNVPTAPWDAAKAAMIQSGVNALPETSLVEGAPTLAEAAINAGKRIGGNVAKGLSKIGSVLSGAKPQDLMQAYDQGLSTYAAPSIQKAGQIFSDTAKAEGINTNLPTNVAYSPQLSEARQMATDIVTKMKSGTPLTAQEALQGRQAVDYVIGSTPPKAKGVIAQMMQDRSDLNDALASASEPMSNASSIYRQAKVKSNLMQPLRVNKSGNMGSFEPILAMLASAGTHSILPAAAAVGTSPLAIGGMASTVGSMGNLVSSLMQNPITRQAFMGAIANHLTKEQSNGQQPNQP